MAGKKGQAPRVEFSQGLFDGICKRIALGGSLRSICAEDGMPDRATFNGWRKLTDALQTQYDQACKDREDHYFEQIVDIADECRVGIKKTTKANGDVETVEIDMVERAKVQIDARKWVLARMNRKKFGDRVTNEHVGEDGNPIALLLQHVEGTTLKPKGSA
ncbi:hypothetical protein R75461_01148 [Paraburkholderia nemoris]|uniref:terminase small subunit-like protein n=1 Tax=Paraburkholderia nemoris TaxID=2793076 RepID=UPI001B28EFB8|nr:hypothetical protein [Paraburkholderia nemoris]CAE6713029.1 hypothetical protein R75461_01148 [Paraburkholderia nemoris]